MAPLIYLWVDKHIHLHVNRLLGCDTWYFLLYYDFIRLLDIHRWDPLLCTGETHSYCSLLRSTILRWDQLIHRWDQLIFFGWNPQIIANTHRWDQLIHRWDQLILMGETHKSLLILICETSSFIGETNSYSWVKPAIIANTDRWDQLIHQWDQLILLGETSKSLLILLGETRYYT